MQKTHPSTLGELYCTQLKDLHSASEWNEELVRGFAQQIT